MAMLFITNYFYPKPLANGVCVFQLAKAALRDSSEIYVICYKRDDELDHEIIDGINIFRIELPKYHNWMFSEELTRRGYWIKRCGILISRIRKLCNFYNYPLRDYDVVRRIVKNASSLISLHKIDTVVCSYTPIEAIKAGQLLKKRFSSIKYVFYSLDTLSNERGFGILPEKIRRYYGIRSEKKYFKYADIIILMNCHKNHYENSEYNSFRDKIEYADFPLLVPVESPQTIYENDEKVIVYAGSLYREIRNPGFALRVLNSYTDRYYLDFYGYSDCDDIIQSYVEKSFGHIRIHGLVPYDIVQNEMQKADILLSIGNKGTDMAPSKIYELISTGKPIIHFYSNDYDPCLYPLKKYHNCLIIKENEIPEKNIMLDFLNNTKSINTKELFLEYEQSTPEFTLNLIDRKTN